MSLVRRVKFAIVAVLVGVGGVNFVHAQRPEAGWPTLVAAGEIASHQGIKSYRVSKPIVDNDQILIKADVLGEGSAPLGSFESRKGINGKISLTESLMWSKREIKAEFEGHSGSLTIDGVSVYSGEIKEQGREIFSDDAKAMMSLLGAIETDLSSFARDVRILERQADQVGWLPRGLRPTAMSILRYLPTPETLYAAAPDSGISCTGSGQCEFGFSSTKTGACNSAVQGANYDCTNAWCLGCCEIQNPGCDCDCASGDFFCGCLSCGVACRGGEI